MIDRQCWDCGTVLDEDEGDLCFDCEYDAECEDDLDDLDDLDDKKDDE